MDLVISCVLNKVKRRITELNYILNIPHCISDRNYCFSRHRVKHFGLGTQVDLVKCSNIDLLSANHHGRRPCPTPPTPLPHCLCE